MKFGTAAFALFGLAAGVVAAPVAQNNPQGYTPQNAQWNAAAQPQNFNPAQNAAPAPAPYPQQGSGNGGLGLPLIGNLASPLSGLGGGNGAGIGGIGLGGGNSGGIGGLGNPLDMVKGLGGGLLPLKKRQGGSTNAGANADANAWTNADGYGGVGANGFANADAHAEGQGHGGNNVQIAGLPFVGNIANAPSAVLDVAQDAVGQAAGSVMGLANGLMGGNARAGVGAGASGFSAPGNY